MKYVFGEKLRPDMRLFNFFFSYILLGCIVLLRTFLEVTIAGCRTACNCFLYLDRKYVVKHKFIQV